MEAAKTREFKPVPLPVEFAGAHGEQDSSIRLEQRGGACCPGADAKLKEEAVLYTAHYDHLGIRPDMPGDNIYNGANDNATGCGILLEIARAYLDGDGEAAALVSCLRPSPRKSKACSARNIWASIRQLPAGKSRLI